LSARRPTLPRACRRSPGQTPSSSRGGGTRLQVAACFDILIDLSTRRLKRVCTPAAAGGGAGARATRQRFQGAAARGAQRHWWTLTRRSRAVCSAWPAQIRAPAPRQCLITGRGPAGGKSVRLARSRAQQPGRAARHPLFSVRAHHRESGMLPDAGQLERAAASRRSADAGLGGRKQHDLLIRRTRRGRGVVRGMSGPGIESRLAGADS